MVQLNERRCLSVSVGQSVPATNYYFMRDEWNKRTKGRGREWSNSTRDVV